MGYNMVLEDIECSIYHANATHSSLCKSTMG